MDFRRTEVHRAGQRVELSAKEFRLLRYLISRRGETLGRNELLDEEENPRRPQHILTIHGLGYKFAG